jgi:DNA-binding response OmpR family regulator
MPRILIIDDDPRIRAMLKKILTDSGYEIEEAEDGDEGVELFRKNPADLVITDIIMPEKDGISTIIQLKKEYPAVKIIAMSAGGRIEAKLYLESAKALGAKHSLHKGFDKNELLRVVRELLG